MNVSASADFPLYDVVATLIPRTSNLELVMREDRPRRKRLSSGSPLEPVIGFSRAVRSGQHVAVAGTAPIGPDRGTVGVGDAYLQARRCLEIIEQALNDAGARLEHVIRTRVFLTNIADWEAVARAHGEVFGGIGPACTMMEVSRFIDERWLVEIEVDAIVDDEAPHTTPEASQP